MASPAIKANQQVIGMNSISNTIFMGIGATLATDIWSVVRRRLFGTPMANYGLVGRWFLHMRHGKFRHEQIAGASKVRWEDAVGWVAHYLIGIAFAALFLFICDAQWTLNPTPFPALGFGIGPFPIDATRHGGRFCRQSHSSTGRGSPAKHHQSRRIWSRALSFRPHLHLHLWSLECESPLATPQ